jgi:hypothetical protein
MLHPSAYVTSRHPNMNKTKRFTGLKAILLEEKMVANKLQMCVVFHSNESLENSTWFIDMYCVQRYCTVEVEGPVIHYFEEETTTDEVEEVIPKVIEEQKEEEETTNFPTVSIRHDEEDIREIRAEVEIDYNNQPAPENPPLAADNVVSFGEWGHSGI